MIELLYMRVNIPTIMKHYKSRAEVQDAIIDLMESGKNSDTAIHWESTQTMVDKIACGIV